MMNPFEEALRRIDAENSQDPHGEDVAGKRVPKELLYAERLTKWVRRLQPEASEALLLAARCQHLCRWKIPRTNYERNRAGYLRWRAELKEFHAECSGAILREVGYGEEMVTAVQDLNRKKNLTTDPDCQVLEDALCLVTLEFQLDELIERTDREKLVGILRKTWKKMSPSGREAALTIPFPPAQKELIVEALAEGSDERSPE